MLAHDHPAVDLDAGADQHLGPLLQVEEGERDRRPRAVGDEHPLPPVLEVARAGAVLEEAMVQLALAARVREELGAVSEQPA